MKYFTARILGLGSLVLVAMAHTIQMGSDISETVKKVKYDLNGVLHVDAEGILRSYDQEGNVIDYRRLDFNTLNNIAQLYAEENSNKLIDLWSNVDSSLVDEEQVWAPPSHLMPPSVSEADAAEQLQSANPKVFPRWWNYCNQYRCTENWECLRQDPICIRCVRSGNFTAGMCFDV
ncbi:hypothetical protein I7I53_02148 [Histoplasma capsulatum var. duboisii H88]|uniref:RanBP2-type domain-containing protein n=1 Tax=Ajellomyces capsulatus (strain H88) TaxID=544711 RepID=A0A8A1LPP2_AJEC8|nr:hypothetical protein I7I53_02148 [Histoplasma capsulatum var. duboisii H88]